MIRPMFSVYDRRAGMYSNPFPHVNRGTAMRAMQDQLRNPDDPMRRSAVDYELKEIGTFDDETGRFESGEVSLVVILSDLLSQVTG